MRQSLEMVMRWMHVSSYMEAYWSCMDMRLVDEVISLSR